MAKGLSQILYLIIAASVLMMVALSLIFSFTSGSNTSAVSSQACLQAMQTTCQNAPSLEDDEYISLPGSCTRTDNSGNSQLIQGVDANAISGVDTISAGQGFQCE